MSSESPDWLDRARNWLTTPIVRLALCWLVCLGVTAQRWYHARYQFETNWLEPADTVRADGNYGHTHIDFGGQWVFGRLAATGQFRSLYSRDAQWTVVNAAYPLDRQSEVKRRYSFVGTTRPSHLKAEDVQPDCDYLMGCILGEVRDAERANALARPLAVALSGGLDGNPFGPVVGHTIATTELTTELERFQKPVFGGPLYPPVHAFLYAPLGMIANPQTAYFTFQWVSIAAVYLCGWCVSVLSNRRVWWPIAVAVILCYPGGRPGLDLGQNHYLTLAVILSGWTLSSRGYPLLGGAVWGLLAFKPVWGLAFILAPVLTRNWRFVLGTGVSGCLLVLLTVPFVGIQGWQDWLAIGKEASAKYEYELNWTNLSRDVFGLSRRMTIDFDKPPEQRVTPDVTFTSFASLGAVLLLTVGIALWRVRAKRTIGLGAAFVLFGAYLSCYRFMYYDAVLALAGFAALCANPRWFLLGPQGTLTRPTATPADRRVRLFLNSFPLTVLALQILIDNVIMGINPKATFSLPNWPARMADGEWILIPRTVTTSTDYNFAVDTYLVLAAWAWCGWRLLRDGRKADEESMG